MSRRNWSRAKREVEAAQIWSWERLDRIGRHRKAKPVPKTVELEVTWANGNVHMLPYDGPRTRGDVRNYLSRFSVPAVSVSVWINGSKQTTFMAATSAADPTRTPGSAETAMADATKSPLSNRDAGALGRRAGTRKDSPATEATTSRAS